MHHERIRFISDISNPIFFFCHLMKEEIEKKNKAFFFLEAFFFSCPSPFVSDVNTTQLSHRKVFDFVPTHSTKIRCDQRNRCPPNRCPARSTKNSFSDFVSFFIRLA